MDPKQYKATHEEKQGIIRELRLKEERLGEDCRKDKAESGRLAHEALLKDPKVKPLLKRHEALKKEQEKLKVQLRKLGLYPNYQDGFTLDNEKFNALQAEVDQVYKDKFARLSELRSKILLAFTRAEVETLYKEAQSI